jgi:hypothetical protein
LLAKPQWALVTRGLPAAERSKGNARDPSTNAQREQVEQAEAQVWDTLGTLCTSGDRLQRCLSAQCPAVCLYCR